MDFDNCQQLREKNPKTKQNKNHSTVRNNFYFLVSEFWLSLMLVSMFVLESRQVVHSKSWTPNTMTERQCKAQHSPFYFPVYWVEIFQKPNFPKLYANLKSFLYFAWKSKYNLKHSNPAVCCRFFLTQHKCAFTCSELFYLIIHSKTFTETFGLWYSQPVNKQ